MTYVQTIAVRFVCLLVSLGAVPGAPATAQMPSTTAPAAATQDSIEVQRLRNEMIRANKTRRYYTGLRFDVDQLPHYVAERKLAGTLHIWGLNYIADAMLAEYWAEGFKKLHPAVTIEYTLPTALASTSGLVTGAADIGANRKMTFTELLQYERMFNRPPLEVPMATGSLDIPGWSDAMVIFVHKSNPITGLTLEQLDGIFGAARKGGSVGTAWHAESARGPEKNIRTWDQLGLSGEWKGRRIQPYGGIVRYDTATKFSDAVLGGSDKWNEDTLMYSNYAAPDGTFVTWQRAIANDLAHDPAGIGYTGHGLRNDDIKAVPIQFEKGGPFVMPTLQTLQDRSYKLFQANYWYVNKVPGQPLDPKVREFLRYVLSREGQEQVIRDGKYLPLNLEVVRKALASLD